MAQTLKRRKFLTGWSAGRWGAGLLAATILAWAHQASAAPPPPAGGPDKHLKPAQDLQAEAAAAVRSGFPLVLMFSRKDCPYCITIRQDYLVPLTRMPRFRQVLVRQIDQDLDTPLRDFNGRATTHAAFAAEQHIRLVPVVAFFGPRGTPLAEPIVGARLPDFYQRYLEESLTQGRQSP